MEGLLRPEHVADLQGLLSDLQDFSVESGREKECREIDALSLRLACVGEEIRRVQADVVAALDARGRRGTGLERLLPRNRVVQLDEEMIKLTTLRSDLSERLRERQATLAAAQVTSGALSLGFCLSSRDRVEMGKLARCVPTMDSEQRVYFEDYLAKFLMRFLPVEDKLVKKSSKLEKRLAEQTVREQEAQERASRYAPKASCLSVIHARYLAWRAERARLRRQRLAGRCQRARARLDSFLRVKDAVEAITEEVFQAL